jgi:hypothetical protein
MTDTSMPGEQIALPLPNEPDRAFGYSGPARFVGFRYTCLGDHVLFEDGHSSGSGATWSYLAFKRHRAVEPFLRDANLDSSEEDGTQRLLIDRDTRTASIAPLYDARVFLDSQWAGQEPMTQEQQELFCAEIKRLLEEQRNQPFDWEAAGRQQREQETRMAVMLTFLDQQVPPSQGEGQTP